MFSACSVKQPVPQPVRVEAEHLHEFHLTAVCEVEGQHEGATVPVQIEAELPVGVPDESARSRSHRIRVSALRGGELPLDLP